MSEEILIQKKKKKILSIQEAIKLLKPFVEKWQKIDEETARKIYEVYQKCEYGSWKYVLEGLNIPNSTWYYWLEKYNLDVKQPQEHESSNIGTLEEGQELEPAVVEDEQETEYDTIKYQETYSILNNAQRLSINMFELVEKKELIDKLQKTIKHLTTLLLKLESNIE